MRTYDAILGAENTFTVTDETFLALRNGNHRLIVMASDGVITSTSTWTLTKAVHSGTLTLQTPLAADDMPVVALMNITGLFPEGAILKVEVCNNAHDETPAWENVTSQVLSGNRVIFSNTAKTATNWGFNFRVTLERGAAVGDCYISGIGGNYK